MAYRNLSEWLANYVKGYGESPDHLALNCEAMAEALDEYLGYSELCTAAKAALQGEGDWRAALQRALVVH